MSDVYKNTDGTWTKRFHDSSEFVHSVAILVASGHHSPIRSFNMGDKSVHMDHSGEPLSVYMRNNRMKQPEIVDLATQVAAYLHFLHNMGLYHGDLLNRAPNGRLCPTIAHFGINMGNVLVRPDPPFRLSFIDPHTTTPQMESIEREFVARWMPTPPTRAPERYVTPERRHP
jgi:serine/threonine protein kinase